MVGKRSIFGALQRSVGWLLVVIALLGIGATASWWWINRVGLEPAATDDRVATSVAQDPTVLMPDLEGLHVIQAELALDGLGVLPADITIVEQPIASARNQLVVRQSPSAGTTLPSKVVLTISRLQTIVPDVSGLNVEIANQILHDQGYADDSIIVEEEVQAGPSGIVLGQRPRPGTVDSATVTLTVSASGAMPDLVGSTESAALDVIESLSASALVSYAYDQDVPIGQVMSQNPGPGFATPLEVELTVSGEGRSVYLRTISRVESDSCSTAIRQVDGTEYTQSFRCTGRSDSNFDSTMGFNLGRDWNELIVTIGIDDTSTPEASAVFRVIADDVAIESVQVEFGEAVELTVDVRGVLRLTLQADSVGPDGTTIEMVWGDPLLVGQPEVVQP